MSRLITEFTHLLSFSVSKTNDYDVIYLLFRLEITITEVILLKAALTSMLLATLITNELYFHSALKKRIPIFP